MEAIDILIDLCNKQINAQAEWNAKLIKGEGSNRKYYRLTHNGISYIGVLGENSTENNAFICLSKHFRQKGLPVPEVYQVSEDGLCYIQEDLGNTSLFESIASGIKTHQFNDNEIEILKKTIAILPKLQFEGGKGLDYKICYPLPEMDRRCVLWDLNYFKYDFLKLVKADFDEPALEDDFQRLADDLMQEKAESFMYRDFQSRNVMIKNGEPYMIDFQGGRKGPNLYDLASFVWQAKANYPTEVKKILVDTYFEHLQAFEQIDRDAFDQQLQLMVLFRTLQVLGAYGYRGLFEKKAHFIESIPFAIQNLKDILAQGSAKNYPHLQQVLTALTEKKELQIKEKKTYDLSKLTVKVYSFSYKKGIPSDDSGNGGGYVFDCRGVHNPGKYDQYKPLTGRDKPVIDFLENDGEILKFLENIYNLADAHVQRYIERGFSSLMFSFGCTGGQHRSVYSAQHVAEHIAKKFGVKVILEHREQNIKETFNAD